MTYKIAHDAMIEAVQTGDLAELANGFFRTNNNDLKSGCVIALFECLAALKTAGIPCLWPEDERATSFIAKTTTRIQAEVLIHINDSIESSWRLSAIVGYISTNAARLSFPAPTAPTAPQPMPVHVVSLPQRVTHMTVERDTHDEIVSTTKIERDYV